MERHLDTIAARVLRAAVACTAALAIVMTWPLATSLERLGRTTTMDGLYCIWNVAWVARTIVVSPTRRQRRTIASVKRPYMYVGRADEIRARPNRIRATYCAFFFLAGAFSTDFFAGALTVVDDAGAGATDAGRGLPPRSAYSIR